MACRFTELIVDARDPEALARFWGDVLGWEVGESNDEIAWLKPPGPPVPLIAFVPVPEGKSVKNRIHIDVSPTDRSPAVFLLASLCGAAVFTSFLVVLNSLTFFGATKRSSVCSH